MPLRPVPELLAAARQGGYALGYFESWNLESLQGVLDAAEQTRSPIIIGFSGDFLTLPDRLTREDLRWYGAVGRAAAEAASVPCGFIFNECPYEEEVRKAVQTGFNLVMLASGELPYDEYLRQVAALVPYAHAHGAAVEAEIGELPIGSTGEIVTTHASQTDPDLAAQFVKATAIDLLSVSVGNVHVLLDGQRGLDLERLDCIRQKVNLPLGLHGGTGIPTDSLREAIRLGVAKVAYGTYVKQRYLAAVRQALSDPEINPHRLLGMGGPEDVLVAGRRAVKEAVLERIESLGCCGRA